MPNETERHRLGLHIQAASTIGAARLQFFASAGLLMKTIGAMTGSALEGRSAKARGQAVVHVQAQVGREGGRIRILRDVAPVRDEDAQFSGVVEEERPLRP